MTSHVPPRLVGPQGQQVPLPGQVFGTWKSPNVIDMGALALMSGMALDTAEFYGNLREVGVAAQLVIDGGRDASTVTIIIKTWPSNFGYDKTVKSVRAMVVQLPVGVNVIALLHWPGQRQQLMLDSYRALERCQRDGLVTHIGVSNFDLPHLLALRNDDRITTQPLINQVERHLTFAPNVELLRVCRHWGIGLMASSALGGSGAGGGTLANPAALKVLQAIAAVHANAGDLMGSVTPAQVALAYISRHYIPVYSTRSAGRLQSNILAAQLVLSADEITVLDAFATSNRHRPNPREFDNRVSVSVLAALHRTGLASLLDRHGLLR